MRRFLAVATIALITCVAETNRDATTSFAREQSVQYSEVLSAADAVDSAAPAEVTDLPSMQFDPSPAIVEDTTSSLDSARECECGECVVADCDCSCHSHGGWTFDLGAAALQSRSAVSDNEEWFDDFGPAGRIALGYEWANGFGIRAQGWGYNVKGEIGSQTQLYSPPFFYYSPYYLSDDYNYQGVPYGLNRPLYYSPGYVSSLPYTREVEIKAATAFLDFSKSIYSRHGEFSFGMGPAYGYLEFEFPPFGGNNYFSGGGLTVFGRGYIPAIGRNRWEIGFAGQSRFTMLAGHWDSEWSADDVDFGGTMSIVELRIGPEFRYRIGPTADRHLFLRTVAEFQQWRSDGMGPLGGDTLGLHGVSLDGGIKW